MAKDSRRARRSPVRGSLRAGRGVLIRRSTWTERMWRGAPGPGSALAGDRMLGSNGPLYRRPTVRLPPQPHGRCGSACHGARCGRGRTARGARSGRGRRVGGARRRAGPRRVSAGGAALDPGAWRQPPCSARPAAPASAEPGPGTHCARGLRRVPNQDAAAAVPDARGATKMPTARPAPPAVVPGLRPTADPAPGIRAAATPPAPLARIRTAQRPQPP